ncbi:MAG: PaREP1 family protein [Desulfurococcales archaeon]
MKLSHPWRDLRGYIEAGLEEAEAEFQLASKFLEERIHRNAAGKAFQGWKAALAAAALNIEKIGELLKGKVRMRDGKIVSRAEWAAAFMPIGLMRPIAKALESAYGEEIVTLTDLALNLHEFQYNGLDETGVLSRYLSLDHVKSDIEKLISRGKNFVSMLRRSNKLTSTS